MPKRILMLGNSLTAANDLPQKLADALCAQVCAHTRSGARLSEHLHVNTVLGRRTQEALSAASWDFTVLREMSSGPLRFPAAYLRSAAALCRQIRAAGAEPVLLATWSFAPGSSALAKTGCTYTQMHETMQAVFREAVDLTGAQLCNAGEAFFLHPDPLSLYCRDGVHPNEKGTQCVLETLLRTLRECPLAVRACAQYEDRTV